MGCAGYLPQAGEISLNGERIDTLPLHERAQRGLALAPDEYLQLLLDKTLSGGERKRIELAGVLALRPRLAILDEPTAGIDILSLDEVMQVIETLRLQYPSPLLAISNQVRYSISLWKEIAIDSMFSGPLAKRVLSER